MTVELSVLDYITHLALAFIFGMIPPVALYVVYNEIKKDAKRAVKEEIRKQ